MNVNLAGRESDGVVAAGDFERVRDELARAAGRVRRSADRAAPRRARLAPRGSVQGQYAEEAPDLLLEPAPLYSLTHAKSAVEAADWISGDHRMDGVLAAAGPHVATGEAFPDDGERWSTWRRRSWPPSARRRRSGTRARCSPSSSGGRGGRRRGRERPPSRLRRRRPTRPRRDRGGGGGGAPPRPWLPRVTIEPHAAATGKPPRRWSPAPAEGAVRRPPDPAVGDRPEHGRARRSTSWSPRSGQRPHLSRAGGRRALGPGDARDAVRVRRRGRGRGSGWTWPRCAGWPSTSGGARPAGSAAWSGARSAIAAVVSVGGGGRAVPARRPARPTPSRAGDADATARRSAPRRWRCRSSRSARSTWGARAA